MHFNLISIQGEILPLVNNKYFALKNVDGHTKATANISSSAVVGMDGDKISNVQANARTIIIDLVVREGIDVEEAKRYVLTYVKLKKPIKINWLQNDRDITISGIVEDFEMPRYNKNVTMQITIHCENPFWESAEVVETISEIINRHYFTNKTHDMLYFTDEGIVLGEYDVIRTKEFYNDGDVTTGLTITIQANEQVTNPVIYDNNGNFFALNIAIGKGDVIVITTHKGNKKVTLNGVNIINKVRQNSYWLQLEPGLNKYTINADETNLSNMFFNLAYTPKYI